jgi:hypothetical protein
MSSGDQSAATPTFPSGGSTALTPQDLALAFMVFDISSCIGPAAP